MHIYTHTHTTHTHTHTHIYIYIYIYIYINIPVSSGCRRAGAWTSSQTIIIMYLYLSIYLSIQIYLSLYIYTCLKRLQASWSLEIISVYTYNVLDIDRFTQIDRQTYIDRYIYVPISLYIYLSQAVVGQLELGDHVAGVVGGRVHGGHARGLLRGLVLEQAA